MTNFRRRNICPRPLRKTLLRPTSARFPWFPRFRPKTTRSRFRTPMKLTEERRKAVLLRFDFRLVANMPSKSDKRTASRVSLSWICVMVSFDSNRRRALRKPNYEKGMRMAQAVADRSAYGVRGNLLNIRNSSGTDGYLFKNSATWLRTFDASDSDAFHSGRSNFAIPLAKGNLAWKKSVSSTSPDLKAALPTSSVFVAVR